MPFFARPNLDNEQFKQLSGTTLTLSGTTQIAEQGGLQLPDGGGGYIPVVTCGAVNQTVLTYIETGSTCCLVLLPPTSGASTGIYTCASPTTCTVGGLSSGSPILNCGIDKILEMILVPTLNPTLTPPFSQFSINPPTTPLEVGCSVVITGSLTFNCGCINPQYTSASDKRSGAPTAYSFSQWGAPYVTGASSSCVFAARTITAGNNIAYGCVHYAAGVQPKDSAGNDFSSPLPAGSTNSSCPSAIISRTIVGIYPWFYGSSASVPVVNSALLTTATCKCVGFSTGDIVATNYNVSGQYIWFAIPCASTSMLKWQGSNSPSNCGSIPGDLFASEVLCSVNSPSGCWASQCYRFYVSNYPTSINYCMTFKRS